MRAWLAAHVPELWREELRIASRDEYVEFQQWWRRELRAGGLLAAHWPKEWGGAELSLADQLALHEEMARADAPRLSLFFVSLHHVPATLLHAGTLEQQARHLPAVLDGEIWCQGFSEPEAGSDLASLRTRAERRGDTYVVNGQKVWSSMADQASYCLLLARTDPSAPKRDGISYFLLDLSTPGVEIRPIRQATGASEFCEIFLTDVEIPVRDRLGEEGDGWRIARATLNAERGVTIPELVERLRHRFEALVALAGRAGIDAAVADQLAALEVRVEVVAALARGLLAELVARGEVGVEASALKVVYSEVLQDLGALGVELGGPDAQLDGHAIPGSPWDSGSWVVDYLNSWSWTIAGGTNEIQRTVIGEQLLGLPR